MVFFFFFFFQAEDGIRDVAVTGVQTCALPILPERRSGGVIVRTPGPVGAVSITTGRVPVRVSALPVIADVGAHLSAVIAVDLHHAGEDLVNIERSFAVALHSQALEAGRRAA